MEQQKKIISGERKRAEGSPAPAGEEPSSNLLEQARGWGGVARNAHDNCQRGVEAEQEVRRRRNQPGQ